MLAEMSVVSSFQREIQLFKMVAMGRRSSRNGFFQGGEPVLQLFDAQPVGDGGIAASHDESIIMKSAHAHFVRSGDKSSHGRSLRDLPILPTMAREVKLFSISSAYRAEQ